MLEYINVVKCRDGIISENYLYAFNSGDETTIKAAEKKFLELCAKEENDYNPKDAALLLENGYFETECSGITVIINWPDVQ